MYKIRFEYPKKDFAFAGVVVIEALVHGMSEYFGLSGAFSVYSVFTLEDGNKVFSCSTRASMLSTNAQGKVVVGISAAENYIGGTGRFKGIRAQVHNLGERELVAKSIKQQTSGEYCIGE